MSYKPMKTTTSGLSAGMQTWADRIMLKNENPVLVHAQGAVQKHIPPNSGKIVQWRRWTPLPTDPDDALLAEGVIPDGQDLSEEEVTATVYQYGRYTTKTDLFDLTHMDADLADEIALLSQQGAGVRDTVIRDVMATTTTSQYANSKTSIYTLATTDELNVDEIRKMVRTLKNNKAPMFNSKGKQYYMAIIGPDAEYDIMSDTKWLYPKDYVDTKDIYNGELGMLYRVRFLMTTECKKYENEELIDGQVYLTTASIAGAVVTVDEAITTAEAVALVGRYVNVVDATDGVTCERQQIVAAASGMEGAATVTLDAAVGGFTQADGDVMWANEYGWNGNTVYGTFVFGDRAYATADIKGSGRMRTIVKSAKDIGGPLEQFGTVGWKIPALACEILQDLWIGQIYHGATA